MSFQYFKNADRNDRHSLKITPAKSRLKKISFRHEILLRGKSIFLELKSQEGLVTLLQGKVEVLFKRKKYILGPRSNVFSGPSHSFYCGENATVRLKALLKSELIISCAPRRQTHPSFHIPPQKVRKRRVGTGTYSRNVHDILREDIPGDRLLAGETFNKPGKWSSFPPHKHDKNRLPYESKLEELYFFKVNPENKFGIIRLYGMHKGKAYDEAVVIHNNDCIIIPFGYHPVCAAPDTEIYYYWVLAGEKRKLRCSEDTNYL
ncbi:5-deoxy-glucuronate isomerase [Candidatus Omnitrophota bacterium]